MQTDRWHSAVRVSVSLPYETRLRDLRTFLLADGYVQDNEVIRVRRQDSNHCTSVTVQYLLPWLPIEHAESFVSAALRLSQHFGSPMLHGGKHVDGAELKDAILRLSDDLAARVDAPGSEFLAIAIAEDLPL